jgi:predicted MPP superfamily phosphohydrolase
MTIHHKRIALAGLAQPLTVVQISDVHIRRPGGPLRVIAEALSSLEVDLVLLTGDLIAREWQWPALHDFLAKLPIARLGRFAIMGNWEYWAGVDPDRWERTLAQHGITLLRNGWRTIGPIELAGIDDYMGGTPDFTATLSPGDAPRVVMSHCPILFDELVGSADLVLSGHTHGGQARLPGLGALAVPRGSGRRLRGLHHSEDTWLHVSAGLGWSMVPLRWRCPPEIAILTLEAT